MSAVAAEPATTLPVWNLNDLYPSMTAPELSRDLEAAQRAAEALQARYEGKLAGLGGAALAAAIAEYEALQDVLQAHGAEVKGPGIERVPAVDVRVDAVEGREAGEVLQAQQGRGQEARFEVLSRFCHRGHPPA